MSSLESGSLGLQKLHVTKDRIVEQIFLKLGKREGIKLREVFNLVVPELVEVMPDPEMFPFLGSSENRQSVVLEAGYPEIHHGIGNDLPCDGSLHRSPCETNRPLRRVRKREDFPELHSHRQPPGKLAFASGSQTVSGGPSRFIPFFMFPSR